MFLGTYHALMEEFKFQKYDQVGFWTVQRDIFMCATPCYLPIMFFFLFFICFFFFFLFLFVCFFFLRICVQLHRIWSSGILNCATWRFYVFNSMVVANFLFFFCEFVCDYVDVFQVWYCATMRGWLGVNVCTTLWANVQLQELCIFTSCIVQLTVLFFHIFVSWLLNNVTVQHRNIVFAKYCLCNPTVQQHNTVCACMCVY